MLKVAIDYLRMVPHRHKSFWQALKIWVKEAILQQFRPLFLLLSYEVSQGFVLPPQSEEEEPQAPPPPPEPLPPQEQQEVEELAGWLANASKGELKDFKDMLEVAIEYLRMIPHHRMWLWQAIEVEVKEAAFLQFPEYYQSLLPEAEKPKDISISPVNADPLFPQERRDIKELAEWLEQFAEAGPKDFEDMLMVAVGYLSIVPPERMRLHQAWLWRMLPCWVKEAMSQQFPEYYRSLLPEAETPTDKGNEEGGQGDAGGSGCQPVPPPSPPSPPPSPQPPSPKQEEKGKAVARLEDDNWGLPDNFNALLGVPWWMT
jgi:hypothetical protein